MILDLDCVFTRLESPKVSGLCAEISVQSSLAHLYFYGHWFYRLELV